MITSRISAPTSASRWRLKRRQMSCASEMVRVRLTASGGLAQGDARVEPAIQDVRQEIEGDHQTGKDEGDGHNDGRVVGENCADQERADAGHPEDLLGDDRAAEYRGELQGHQSHYRDQRVAHDMLDDNDALLQPL